MQSYNTRFSVLHSIDLAVLDCIFAPLFEYEHGILAHKLLD